MQKEERLKDKLIRLSDELTQFIYPFTFDFPIEERFALASQIRRAAISVPTNIIEGLNRETDKDKKKFMYQAISSLEELKYEVYFANKRGYIGDDTHPTFKEKSERLSKLLGAFINVLKR